MDSSPSCNNCPVNGDDERTQLINNSNNKNENGEEIHQNQNQEQEEFPQTTLEHVKRILSLSIPFSLTYYCIFSFMLTATAFIGRNLGSQALSGYGLGMSFVNLVGFSTVTGSVVGLDTLLPMAYGISPSHPAIAKSVQRCFACVFLWILFIAVIFVTAPLWFHKVFNAHDDDQIAIYAGQVIRMSAITLLPYLLQEILQSYLGALNHSTEIFFGAVMGAAVNPILLYLFVARGWIGIEGAVVAWAIAVSVMFVSTFLLAKYRGAFDQTWKGIDCKVMWSRWKPFLRAALPSAMMMMCEWSTFEINSIAAAKILPHTQFAAQVVLQNIIVFLFPLILGVGIAVNILVGNDVGAGNSASAKKTAWVGLFLILIEFCLDAILVFTPAISRKIAGVFSQDDAVVDYVTDVLRLVFASHVFDGLFCLLSSILRALGHNRKGVIFAVTGYYVVSFSVGWTLALHVMNADAKIYAMWIGPACGQLTAVVMATAFVCCKMEWVAHHELAQDLALSSDDEGEI